MGVVIYLSKFARNLAKVAGPISTLQGCQTRFKWTHKEEPAFIQIKKLLHSGTILKPIDHDSPGEIYIITDASNTVIGSWLGQESRTDKDDNKEWKETLRPGRLSPTCLASPQAFGGTSR